MQFNFDRSVVLSVIKVEDDAVYIVPTFNGTIVRLPRDRVKYLVVDELRDSSVRVVDFGNVAKGSLPRQAIVGVGDKSKLFAL